MCNKYDLIEIKKLTKNVKNILYSIVFNYPSLTDLDLRLIDELKTFGNKYKIDIPTTQLALLLVYLL